MKRTILSALFLILSMNSFAQTTLDLEEIYNSKLLQKGTKIGKCEVFAIAASRTYGSGPVDLLEVGLQRADKKVVARIFQDYLKISTQLMRMVEYLVLVKELNLMKLNWKLKKSHQASLLSLIF